MQGCQKEPAAAALRRLLGVSCYLLEMIEDIRSCQPEVKASKLDNWLRSYGHLRFSWFLALVEEALMPTHRHADTYSENFLHP